MVSIQEKTKERQEIVSHIRKQQNEQEDRQSMKDLQNLLFMKMMKDLVAPEPQLQPQPAPSIEIAALSLKLDALVDALNRGLPTNK